MLEIGLTAALTHEIVCGISANSASWWDNSRAQALGYRARHSADGYAEQLRGKRSDCPVAELYQGGSYAADGYVSRSVWNGHAANERTSD